MLGARNFNSGFRPKHSTESALILMIDFWLKAINEGKIIGCVLVDFRKAFDLVDHHILLKKYNVINAMNHVYRGLTLICRKEPSVSL